jgi:hypothetical protein
VFAHRRVGISLFHGPATGSAPSPPQASPEPKELDDVALARKVETIIFRDEAVPKGQIDVNAAGGVVWLRGEAKTPDMIEALEAQTAEIPEVRKVENLLHLPKTPAPTRTTVGSQPDFLPVAGIVAST